MRDGVTNAYLPGFRAKRPPDVRRVRTVLARFFTFLVMRMGAFAPFGNPVTFTETPVNVPFALVARTTDGTLTGGH